MMPFSYSPSLIPLLLFPFSYFLLSLISFSLLFSSFLFPLSSFLFSLFSLSSFLFCFCLFCGGGGVEMPCCRSYFPFFSLLFSFFFFPPSGSDAVVFCEEGVCWGFPLRRSFTDFTQVSSWLGLAWLGLF